MCGQSIHFVASQSVLESSIVLVTGQENCFGLLLCRPSAVCVLPDSCIFNPSQSSVVLAVCFPPGWNHPVASGFLAPRPSAYLRCQWEQLVGAMQSSSRSIQEPDQGGKRQTELLVHSSCGESSFLLLPSQERGTSLLISAVTQAPGDRQPGFSC